MDSEKEILTMDFEKRMKRLKIESSVLVESIKVDNMYKADLEIAEKRLKWINEEMEVLTGLLESERKYFEGLSFDNEYFDAKMRNQVPGKNF